MKQTLCNFNKDLFSVSSITNLKITQKNKSMVFDAKYLNSNLNGQLCDNAIFYLKKKNASEYQHLNYVYTVYIYVPKHKS